MGALFLWILLKRSGFEFSYLKSGIVKHSRIELNFNLVGCCCIIVQCQAPSRESSLCSTGSSSARSNHKQKPSRASFCRNPTVSPTAWLSRLAPATTTTRESWSPWAWRLETRSCCQNSEAPRSSLARRSSSSSGIATSLASSNDHHFVSIYQNIKII